MQLDAAPHLVENDAVNWNDQPESRALTADIQALVKADRHRCTVCDATAQPLDDAQPGLCGAAFAFGLDSPLLQAANGDGAAVHAAGMRLVPDGNARPMNPFGLIGLIDLPGTAPQPMQVVCGMRDVTLPPGGWLLP